MSGERILVTYRLTLAPGESAEGAAQAIAREQTVELPKGCYPPDVEAQVVGRIEDVERVGDEVCRVAISYDPLVAGDDIPQVVNLLYGNISLKSGIVVEDVTLPSTVLQRFPGPQYGISGVREAAGVEDRPLLCTAAKPMGLSAGALADLCFEFASGGIDIIKDDHGITNQRTAPFRERTERCQEAVLRANAQTGRRSLYFPNITGPTDTLEERLEHVRGVGCRGVLLAPWLLGLDTVRCVARDSGLILFAHPLLTGGFFSTTHGVSPVVMFGQLYRLVGSDGVIYLEAGGRFPFSEDVTAAIHETLRKPMGDARPAFPIAGGGVNVDRVPLWMERYGMDTIFLIGSSLYAQKDHRGASERLLDTVLQHTHTRSVTSA